MNLFDVSMFKLVFIIDWVMKSGIIDVLLSIQSSTENPYAIATKP